MEMLHTHLPMEMEQTECSETSAYKIQTPVNYPEESIQQFRGVSSPLCVEKTNSEVNVSHETTTVVVWIYDGI